MDGGGGKGFFVFIMALTSAASRVSYFNKASANNLCSSLCASRIDLARAYDSCK